MAKNMQPILKRCKALGISPTVMGINKETRRNPKPGRRKQSEYAVQLNEKQKAKFIYGVLEKHLDITMSWRAKPRVLRVKICSSFWKEDLTTLFTASVLPTREERQDRWSTMAILR